MLDPETFARKAADGIGLYPGSAVQHPAYDEADNISDRLRELVSSSYETSFDPLPRSPTL